MLLAVQADILFSVTVQQFTVQSTNFYSCIYWEFDESGAWSGAAVINLSAFGFRNLVVSFYILFTLNACETWALNKINFLDQ